MQGRAGKHFEATLQYAAGCPYARLVLIEAVRGTVLAHSHIHAVLTAAVPIVEKHQVNIRSPLPRGAKSEGDFVGSGKPIDVAHRKPLRHRRRRPGPESFQRSLDVNGHFTAHP